jgi:hypothetical protein
MARIGAFDRHLEPLAWWEAELIPAGWYVDELLVEPASGGVTGTLTATLGSATLSATGTGPSTLSAIVIPSSNNPSYRSGFYSPRRGGTPKYPSLWDGCVGAWAPSLGATGLTLRDESVYGNHGTLTNMDAASDWVVSGGKGALDFDGSNDRVPLSKNIDASPNVTLSNWVRATSASQFQQMIGHDNTATDPSRIWQWRIDQTSGTVRAIFFTSNNTNGQAVSTTNVVGLGWVHVAATWDGATIRVYVNGKEEGSTAFSGAVTNVATVFPILGGSVGSYSGVTSVAGQLDDFRIYNRTLSAKEIRTLSLRRGIAFERASIKLSLSSAPAPTGSVSSTLANASLSSSGTLASGASGTVSAVLADASLSSTGTLAAGASGSVTRTLDAATLASSGTVGSGVTATVSVTLAAATLSASGTLAAGLSGTVARTLDNASLSSSGTVAAGASGTVTRTLDNATLSSTGGAAGSVTGSVSSTLAAVTCSATGTLAAGLSGSVNRTLAGVTSSATGTVAAGASGSVTRTLASATLSSTGSFSAGLTASVNRALDSCVVSSSGTVANGATGTLSVQLASATLVSGNVALGGFRLNVAGEWKNANAFVKVTGTWKSATPFVKVGGVWE